MFKLIKKNACFGIINPASKNQDDVFDRYKYMFDYLEKQGIRVKLGKTFSDNHGYLAGTDEERCQDLMDMFLDKEVDCILCMRGGYGCSRMVNMIDFDIIKNNPKPLIGFSDVTVLLNSIYKYCNIPSFHGLVGIFLGGTKCDSFSYQSFWDMLTIKQKGRVLANPNNDAICYHEGSCDGVLVGGNLSLIATLVGTPYEVDFTDKIVFIEEVTERPYQIDRYLSCIRLSGALKKAKGFVFGHFTECESQDGNQTVDDIIDDYFKDLNVPIIKGFNCGHDFPFIGLPIGVKMHLDSNNKTLTILEEIFNEENN